MAFLVRMGITDMNIIGRCQPLPCRPGHRRAQREDHTSGKMISGDTPGQLVPDTG